MLKRNRLIIILFILNTLVIVSPLITKDRVDSNNELKHVQFGFPIPFITQDQSYFDPPFPYNMRIDLRFGESGLIGFKVLSFISSVFIANIAGLYINNLLSKMQ